MLCVQELRELTKLAEANCIVRQSDVDLGLTPASLRELADSRPRKRIHELLSTVFNELFVRL